MEIKKKKKNQKKKNKNRKNWHGNLQDLALVGGLLSTTGRL